MECEGILENQAKSPAGRLITNPLGSIKNLNTNQNYTSVQLG